AFRGERREAFVPRAHVGPAVREQAAAVRQGQVHQFVREALLLRAGYGGAAVLGLPEDVPRQRGRVRLVMPAVVAPALVVGAAATVVLTTVAVSALAAQQHGRGPVILPAERAGDLPAIGPRPALGLARMHLNLVPAEKAL